jgi:heat shock protein HslJ
VTDHIRAAADPPLDLLVVGGLTIDVLDGREIVGGAARYSTEAALAAGLRVGLHTTAADEPLIREWLETTGEHAEMRWHPAPSTITFEHHGHHAARRLRLRAGTDPIRIPDPDRLPSARSILFAPVADEVTTEALGAIRAPIRAAGLQGWLRTTDAEGWVDRRRLSMVPKSVATALRDLDLLLASVDELRGDDGAEALGRLRAWAGPNPELVVTAGTDGAWLEVPGAPPDHVPAEVVAGRHTIGAGDAFAAVLVARRGAAFDLREAANEATAATARFLASRPAVTMDPVSDSLNLADFNETRWRAARFGPGLATMPSPDAEFSLEIQGDRLAGRSGCNRYMGTWAMDEGRLRIGPLASTMMFCDGLMELERTFLDALQAAAAARGRADRLVLTDEAGTELIELKRAETLVR